MNNSKNNNFLNKSFIDSKKCSNDLVIPGVKNNEAYNSFEQDDFSPTIFSNDNACKDSSLKNEDFVRVSKRQQASPYYQAYMSAMGIKVVSEKEFCPYQENQYQINNPLQYGISSVPAQERTEDKISKKDKAKKASQSMDKLQGTTKKRPIFIIITLLLCLGIFALLTLSTVGVVGFFSAEEGEATIDLGCADVFDSVIHFFYKGDSAEVPFYIEENPTLNYYDAIFASFDKQILLVKVASFALPAFMLLALVVSLFAAIKALIALLGKKPLKLSFMPLITFISVIAIVLFGLIWSTAGIKGIVDYITGKYSILSANVFLYVLIALSFVSLITSKLSYKQYKVKKGKKATKAKVAIAA